MDKHTRKYREAIIRMPLYEARKLVYERLILRFGKAAVVRHQHMIRILLDHIEAH